MKIKILLQTKNYVIVHKPSGFLVYADHRDEENLSLQMLLQEQIQKTVIPVHRLDKQTCGLVMYALSRDSANQIKSLFQSKKIKKTYLAFCHDHVEKPLRLDMPLKKHKEKGTEKALTVVDPLQNIETELNGEKRRYSLVECHPETGRFHQIRRHLKMAKHPIVGDTIYGNSWNNEAFFEKFRVDRALLSAVGLEFQDPWTKKHIQVKTEMDFDFANVLKSFSIKI